MSSPHDFQLFANGGWDGNWFVGYNSMWIVEVSSPSESDLEFERAYIGSRLGRAKTQPIPGKPPWIQQPIPCDIYMGLAPTPAWKESDSYFLVSCDDLTVEGGSDSALPGVGQSQWFWREVPLTALNLKGKNYLGIWSSTPDITTISSGPVLAAGEVKGQTNAWLNKAIQGSPPSSAEGSLETRLSFFTPALVLKLVPKTSGLSVDLEMVSFQESEDGYVWEVQVNAKNTERVRPEISIDGSVWAPFGKPVFQVPYIVKVSRERIEQELKRLNPKKKIVDHAFIRITAWDEWGNRGSTQNFEIYVKG